MSSESGDTIPTAVDDMTIAGAGGEQGQGRARELVVDAEHGGQRLDNFVMAAARDVPRTRVYRGLRKGEIRVNKARRRPDYRLVTGDVVRLPPWAQPRSANSAPVEHGRRLQASRLAQSLAQQVLFENQRLIVLNKPSGVAVHGGSGLSMGVIEALRSERADAGRLELIHRLDRDTSGCLMIAKRRSALIAMHAALRNGQVRKAYVLLVRGQWRSDPGRGRVSCAAPLARLLTRSGERIVRANPSGQAALTHFTCLWAGAQASFLIARPMTGRTHQIRVHAALLGYPIAGDDKYGDRDFNQWLRRRGHTRMCLHAAALEFQEPVDAKRVRIEAPLDEAMCAILKVFNCTDVLAGNRLVHLTRADGRD